jgi:hypothetical protein
MEAGRAKMINGPYKGKYVPINIDIWWFMPNPSGVMSVSAPVQENLEMMGINNIQVSQILPFPPPPKKRKAKKTADQVVKELESGNQGEVQDAADLLFVPTGPICAP